MISNQTLSPERNEADAAAPMDGSGWRLFLKRNLPEPLVLYIKKIRYARTTRTIREDSLPEFEIIRHLVGRGDSVIDLGANMGIFTKYFSDRVGPEGTVYSIEPVRDTFSILRYIVRRLRLGNVRLFNCAVSDREGSVEMEIPLYENGEENFYEAKIVTGPPEPARRRLRVETRRLDSLLGDHTIITFIKCDVEGHEYQVLQSGRSLLENSKPSLFIEIWDSLDDPRSEGFKTCNFLKALGYEAYIFDETGFHKRNSDEKKINYFFLRPEHLPKLENINPKFNLDDSSTEQLQRE